MRCRLLLISFLLVACDPVKARPDECTTAAQCTDPAAPYCIAGSCEASCQTSADCTDATRRVCASDGVCVGCQGSEDCNAQAPICDATARACRGCSKDAECPGAVCIEADGRCTANADVAFVTMMGTDTGSCTRNAPCATLTYALGQLGSRGVIHVLGGALATTSLTLASDVILDGEDTTLSAPSTTTPIAIQGSASVTIEGFRIAAPPPPAAGGPPLPGIAVKELSHVRLHDLVLSGDGSTVVAASGSPELSIRRSHLGSLSQQSANVISCNGAKLAVDQCTLEMTIVGDSMPCEMTITRNRFESPRDGSVHEAGGLLVMENNLVIHRDGFNDSISVGNLRAGSTIRFNTIVNTTAVGSDGAALNCDNTVVVTSNVFAYNSQHPITGSCEIRYSVFDDRSQTFAGTGNQLTGIDTIFVDRGAGDYHLAPASVARGAAEPGQIMVTVDFDGNPRPNPPGSTADSGAFEAR